MMPNSSRRPVGYPASHPPSQTTFRHATQACAITPDRDKSLVQQAAGSS
jgi:hypothetical protein